MMSKTCVFLGDTLATYGFGENHPFGPDRMHAFEAEFRARALDETVEIRPPTKCGIETLRTFHTDEYIEKLQRLSESGVGYLDQGDTPAFKGILDAAEVVAGTVMHAIDLLMSGKYQHAFVPIAGLHHASRESASGFCAVNDCGIAIEALKNTYGLKRIAYVDIDAHHGNGVFYAFEDDEQLIFTDFHEDGRFLYPGTGAVEETGRGKAKGLKLNVPLPPYADDDHFFKLWPTARSYIKKHQPQLIILQAGADSLAGDPITHLQLTSGVHYQVTKDLIAIAQSYAEGRLLALGGGGYNRKNLADAWCEVVRAMAEQPD